MAEAIATLPWVESKSIVTDRRKRQVKFTVTHPSHFQLDRLKKVIENAGYAGTKLLAGPTEK